MKNDLRARFEDADRLHDAGLISDDEMNEIAAQYFASVRAFSTDPVQAPVPRRKLGRPRNESVIDELPPPRAARFGRPPNFFSRQQRYDAILISVMNADGRRNVRRWSREIASACLDQSSPRFDEHQQAVERWLRDPINRSLPRWLRIRLASLFPLKTEAAENDGTLQDHLNKLG